MHSSADTPIPPPRPRQPGPSDSVLAGRALRVELDTATPRLAAGRTLPPDETTVGGGVPGGVDCFPSLIVAQAGGGW